MAGNIFLEFEKIVGFGMFAFVLAGRNGSKKNEKKNTVEGLHKDVFWKIKCMGKRMILQYWDCWLG
jgi:hypothetical protein